MVDLNSKVVLPWVYGCIIVFCAGLALIKGVGTQNPQSTALNIIGICIGLLGVASILPLLDTCPNKDDEDQTDWEKFICLKYLHLALFGGGLILLLVLKWRGIDVSGHASEVADPPPPPAEVMGQRFRRHRQTMDREMSEGVNPNPLGYYVGSGVYLKPPKNYVYEPYWT